MSFLLDKILLNPYLFLSIKVLYDTSFIWLPIIIVYILVDMWINYVRSLFLSTQTFIVLEVKVPKDVFKSPKAAEFFITGLYKTGDEGDWFEKFWQGKTRPWFSLEIAAINGAVHFFIWTNKKHRAQIEANIYSQYPGVEIHEVPDYTLDFNYDPQVNSIYVTEFKLTKEDVFPIKTYVDYGMDKDPKEEYKIDPLTPLIEFIGSLSRDQQVWYQIVVRAHKAEDKDPDKNWSDAKIWKTFNPADIWDRWEKKDLKWAKDAQAQIDKIIEKAKGEKDKDGKIIPGTGRQLTDVEKDTINALGRSISKNGYDVGIRAIYTAPKDVFSPNNIGGIIGSITHFNSHLNGFKPTNGSEERYKNFFLLWIKRSDKKRNKERQEILDAYKRRSFFFKPHKRKDIFVLNAEELATIYHFPGSVSGTPTFTRIESRKAEAPSNIPV